MPIPLRGDFDAAQLWAVARRSKDAAQTRRLLALAAVYDGATRTAAAGIGGVTLQFVQDWVAEVQRHREAIPRRDVSEADSGPAGLIDRKPVGRPSRLDEAHRAALRAVIESGPIPAVHGAVRWRLLALCQWLWDEFGVRIAKPTLSREVRAVGYRTLSARPRHHAQAEGAIDLFRTASLPC